MSSTLWRARRRGERPAIYGRERERAQFRDLLDNATTGHGSAVLISGEAGIGKTTLVNDMIAQAEQRGYLVLTGGCYDLTTTPPYGPWVEITRAYPDDPCLPPLPEQLRDGERMAGIASQADLFVLITDFFSAICTTRPLLLVFEDLHWSDPASLELLRYLTRATAGQRILTCATYRDDEITRQHDLFQMLPVLMREPGIERLNLRPLDRLAIEQLIAVRYPVDEADRVRLGDHLHVRTDGNPFFIAEVLHALEESGQLHAANGHWKLRKLTATQTPALLTQVIERRLERLDPSTRPLFQIAAVIGHQIPLDLWIALTGVSGATLDQAVEPALEERLIDELPDGSGYQFHHALVREVLYGTMMLNHRRELQGKVGEALLETPDPEPDEVAHHFQRAGDPRAAEWLIRAGNRAERRYALRTTIDHFDAALSLLDTTVGTARLRGWLQFRLARLKGPYTLAAALDHSYEALRHAESIDDPYLTSQAHIINGLLHCYQGSIGLGIDEMGRGEAEEQELVATGQLAGLEYFHEHGFEHTSFEIDEEPRTFTVSAGLGTGEGTRGAMPALWFTSIGRFRKARAIAEPLFQDLELTQAELEAASGCQVQQSGERGSFALGQTYSWLGRPDDALFPFQYQFAYNRVHRSAYLPYGVHLELQLRALPYLTDDLDERQRLVEKCDEAAHLISAGQLTDHPFTRGAFAVDLIEGRWEQARQILELTMQMGGAREPVQVARAYRAELARCQDDTDLAWSLVREILPVGANTEPGSVEFHAAIVAQRVAIALALDAGDLQTAQSWLDMHSHWLDWSGVVLGQAERRLLWARYHRQNEDLDRAREILERALTLASEPRQPLALIAANRLLGELETLTGHYARATCQLDTSIELAEACVAPYEAALSRLSKVELFSAASRVDSARALIPSVREKLLSMDAKPALARADRLETMLASSIETYPDGLTRREAEVLGLVGQGLSNRQIAELLFLSVRTVERHVSNIYLKIDAHGRSEAIVYALHHNLLDAPPT